MRLSSARLIGRPSRRSSWVRSASDWVGSSSCASRLWNADSGSISAVPRLLSFTSPARMTPSGSRTPTSCMRKASVANFSSAYASPPRNGRSPPITLSMKVL